MIITNAKPFGERLGMLINANEIERYNLFTFYSTHAALFMEKTLNSAGIDVKLIPVPRIISSSCGLAARTSINDYDLIKNIIANKEIETDKVYIMSRTDNISQVK